MKKAAVNPDLPKSKGQVILEHVLLVLCLCVIALRAASNEGLNIQSTIRPTDLSRPVASLAISAVLLVCFVSWVMSSICGRRLLYRFTGIEAGLCLFAVAAIIAGLCASNKRIAITNIVTLLAPVLMAILLVQLLDSYSKIKLVLYVIAALGVMLAYQCTEQLLSGNEELIEFYEEDPAATLAQQRIVPNSLQHWQFEHRLYSKDVPGFFTTGNSAGSFALLASFAAAAVFIDKYRNRKYYPSGSFWVVTCGAAVVAVFFGLAITHSKGAIAAWSLAAVVFIVLLLFGNWLKARRKVILVTCLLLVFGGGCLVVWYGLTHGRLPGGNSMLVRWQYWYATGQMCADHLLAGVGPGNFPHFYLHYKAASALERVADPHNSMLSILSQYGPLGLVGFLAMIFVPLWRAFPGPASCSPQTRRPGTSFRGPAIVCLIAIPAVLLLIRPIIWKMPPGGSPAERQAAVLILYVMPAAIFVAGFALLALPFGGIRPADEEKWSASISAALFCAAVGLLVHNLIDFAIFEPGVWTAFWAVVASLAAIELHQKSRAQSVRQRAPHVRIVVVVGGLAVLFAFFYYALIPPAKAAARTELAMQDIESVHELLDRAAEADPLDPAALSLNGQVYLQHYRGAAKKEPILLEKAAVCFSGAIGRNEADFKNHETLSDVYDLLSEASTQQGQKDWFVKAESSAKEALKRYPQCGRLHFKLARICEQLGKTKEAMEHYGKAIQIEDSFRRQFRSMYPDEKRLISRLGEERYQTAKRRLEQLSKELPP